MNFKYIFEALFLIGLAWGLIKWVGRTLREQISPLDSDVMPPGNAPEQLSPTAYHTLVDRGIVSPEQLAAMSPRERQFLLDTTGRKLRDSGAIAAAPAAPTGAAPPSGALHCPACGASLLEGVIPLSWASHCGGCGRHLTMRRDGAQVILTVDRFTA
jgi:hypothetical protein